MNNKKHIDDILKKIAKEIEISETEYKKAVDSYNAIGQFIADSIPQYDVKVIPQGSFKLGTVIKPINDKEEYDIDLVAIIDNKFKTASELKNIVGDVFKTSDRYSEKLTEGKRCWTIEYAESAHYHIDILPTMKSHSYLIDRKLLMTNKEEMYGEYSFMITNPEAYYQWFCERMKQERDRLIQEYALRNKMEIVSVPDYKVKTTLQITIEILKRYRDIKFKFNPENKPISIILTTLLANVYSGNETVYELIEKFTKEYILFLEKDSNGKIIIANPVNKEENFADKWELYPERQKAFFDFMAELKKDLVENRLLMDENIIEQSKEYKKLFGEAPIKRVFESIGNDIRIARENGKAYINDKGHITTNKTNTAIRNHNFYGRQKIS